MLLALDESGKDGLMPMPGRSPWLVIGGPLFLTRTAAEGCLQALKKLQTELGGGEFRFSKTNDVRRRAVLACLAEQPFTFHVAVCDRSQLVPNRWRHRTAEDLYLAVAGQLVAAITPYLTECDIVFDTLGSRPHDQRYAKLWQQRAGAMPGGRRRVRNCGPRDSKKELLIQAADYVCGVVAHSLKPSCPDSSYLRLIRRREGQRVEWVEVTPPQPANEEGGPLSQPASSE